jgi:thiamine biosynthesis lipoprotein
MNTVIEQRIFADSAESIYKRSLAELHRIEDMMSFYRESSEVSSVNRYASSQAVKVSEETMHVLAKAKEYALFSKEAFNIMNAPLVQMWKEYGGMDKIPPYSKVEELLSLCANANLTLDKDNNTVSLEEDGCQIDLGAIGKGFAADVCCEVYKREGVQSAFINLGGNVKALGKRPDNRDWTIGLHHPGKERNLCYGAVECTDLSVVTSGAYERYQEIGKQRYHHIIDGQTGYPSKSDLKSATVISSSSLQADALSTALFVMGLSEGSRLISSFAGAEAVLLTKNNEVYLTKGAQPLFTLFEKLPCFGI